MSTLGIVASCAGGLLVLLAFTVKIIVPIGQVIGKAARAIALAYDLFAGRDEMVDEATGKTLDEVPPLWKSLASIRTDLNTQGKAIEQQGQSLSDLTSVVETLADQQADIHELKRGQGELKATVAEHENSIGILIGGHYERGSEALLAAIEKAKAVDVEPDQ